MDLFVWFLQKNASELAQLPQSVNSLIFIAYGVVSLFNRKSSYMAAFFISCMMFEHGFFDSMSECSLYLFTFVLYSFLVKFSNKSKETDIACIGVCIISLVFAYDSFFYGIDGYYGATETIIYNNIEHISLYAHIFLICTLIDLKRVQHCVRGFIVSILYMSRNSAYFVLL